MPPFLLALAITGAAAMPAQAATTRGWQLAPATAEHGLVLTYGVDGPVSYRFECTAKDIVVTETGVTKLLDIKAGTQVGDGPDAVMPQGSALLAVYGGKGNPQFKPAEAVKNPAGGWDLSIRLPKDDKQLKAVGKSEMMSLFTTGYTMAVVMTADDRATWNSFLKQCNAAN